MWWICKSPFRKCKNRICQVGYQLWREGGEERERRRKRKDEVGREHCCGRPLGPGKEWVLILEASRKSNVHTHGWYIYFWFIPCWLPERFWRGSPASELMLPTHTEQPWKMRGQKLCESSPNCLSDLRVGLFFWMRCPQMLSAPLIGILISQAHLVGLTRKSLNFSDNWSFSL